MVNAHSSRLNLGLRQADWVALSDQSGQGRPLGGGDIEAESGATRRRHYAKVRERGVQAAQFVQRPGGGRSLRPRERGGKLGRGGRSAPEAPGDGGMRAAGGAGRRPGAGTGRHSPWVPLAPRVWAAGVSSIVLIHF